MKGGNLKKTITFLLFFLIILFVVQVTPVTAQSGSMMGSDSQTAEESAEAPPTESVEVVLQDILDKQKVTTVQELNLSKVSDNEWERLGDAVMELQHPGESHQVMDRMMGGEGSENLRQMHIAMGQAYLGYGTGNYGPGRMMGGGMMGNWNTTNRSGGGANFPMMGVGSMMGWSNYYGLGLFSLISWLLVLSFFASGTYFFIRKAHKK